MAGQEKWYFTREQLVNSPSRRCGLDGDKELAYRQQAANLIQDMGQRLQVSQLCINTAIVYMHRFYAFHSFTQFHRNAMAAAALFLAAKVEEQPRKLEHVIRVAHMCLHRSEVQHMDTRSDHYQEQAQDMVFNENVLLQTLGFDVVIDHPHTHVVRTCHLVKASKDLAQTSYFMASNSLHLTTMCLQYKPTVVACFCIHLASKWSNWAIPQSNEGKHWFYYVDRSVTAELLEHLTAEFLHIFDRCPSRLKKKIMSISSAQGTGSPQQSGSHPGSIPNSPFDKEPKKIPQDEYDKVDLDKRQQSLFGPSAAAAPPASSTSAAPPPNKMDYREYRERQMLQDRRRPAPTAPPTRPNPAATTSMSSQNPAAVRTSSNAAGILPPSLSAQQQQQQQQHRWPGGVPNQRTKDVQPPPSSASVNSRHLPPHASSSSSHPHLHPQVQPGSNNPSASRQPHRSSSGAQPPTSNPNGAVPPVNNLRPPSRPHPSVPPNLPPPTQVKPPSLFSPEPQPRNERPTVNNVARRPTPILPPVMTAPSREMALPTPISPFSSPPTPTVQRRPEPPAPLPAVHSESISLGHPIPEPPAVASLLSPPVPSILTEDTETDPSAVSSLLKASLPRKADKKKKKEKHKHKDRDRRDERKKHKKDKDRRRESGESRPPPAVQPPIEPVETEPDNSDRQIKITIARERLRTEPQASVQRQARPPPVRPPPPPVVIKISKGQVEESRKRPSYPTMEAGPPPKAPRQHHHHADHRHQGPPPPGGKGNPGLVLGNGQSGVYQK